MNDISRTRGLGLAWTTLTVLGLVLGACSEVPPSNPFDPQTPVAQQARAVVTGTLVLPEGFTDFSLFEGAQVRLVPQSAVVESMSFASVTAEGTFAFEEVAAGPYRLSGEIVGMKPVARDILVERGVDLPLQAYQLVPDLPSDPSDGQWIEGIVRLEGGAETGHGGILVETEGRPFQTLTTSSGLFRLDVPPGSYVLRISADGYGVQSYPDIVVTSAEATSIDDVVLPRDLSASIRGSLTSEIQGFEWVMRSTITVTGQGDERVVSPADDGTFLVELLQPGLYGLRAEAEGHLAAVAILEIGPGMTELEPLVLVPEFAAPEAATTMRGVAQLGDQQNEGGNHFGITVQAYVGDDLVATGQTTDVGTYAFTAARTDYRLVFVKEGYIQSDDLDVVWSRDNERFEVLDQPLTEFAGAVLQPDLSANVAGALRTSIEGWDWALTTNVRLSRDGQTRTVGPNEDGTFEFRELRPGSYALNIDAEGHAPEAQTHWLEAGRTELGVIELTPEFVALLQVAGRVTLADRADHFGITVEAYPGADCEAAQEAAVTSGITTRSGDYRLVLDRRDHCLQFSKGGYTPLSVAFRWDANDNRFEVDDIAIAEYAGAQLAPLPPNTSARISGQVTSPLEMDDWSTVAWVRLISEEDGAPIRPNRDGTFTFDDLAPGLYGIEVTATGYLPLARTVDLGVDEDAQVVYELIPEFQLPEAEPILRGRVTLGDEAGEGASHFGITVQAFIGDEIATTTQTSSAGEFSFRAARRDYRLEMFKAGYQGASGDVTWNVETARFEIGGEELVDYAGLTLAPDLSASVSGRLVSETPNVGWDANAWIHLIGGGERAPIRPNQDGTFRFSELRPGLYGLEVSATGHLPGTRFVDLGPGELDLGDVPVTPELEAPPPPPVMRGTALLGDRAQGESHLGITVQAFIAEDLVGSTQTTEAGQYALTAARTDYRLEFLKEGYVAQVIDVTWSDESERFEVLGDALQVYEGVVLQADLSGRLFGRLTTTIEGWDWATTTTVQLTGEDQERSISPGADGRFEFVNLRPGLYGLDVRAEGHSPVARVVDVGPGDNNLGDLSVEPGTDEPMTGRVRLGDVDAEGDHRGVAVHAFIGEDLVASTVTDESGRFIVQTAQTDHRLRLSKAGYVEAVLDVTWSDDDGMFEVGGQALAAREPTVLAIDPGSIAGRILVMDAMGDATAPAGNVSVSVYAAGSLVRAVVTNAEGRFILEGLRQGLYDLVYGGGESFTEGRELVEVRAGIASDLGDRTIDLRRGQISGVVRPTGGQADGITVRLARPPGHPEEDLVWATTAINGAYRVDGLPPGPYVVFTTAPGFVNVDADFVLELAPGENRVAPDIDLPVRNYIIHVPAVDDDSVVVRFTKDPDIRHANLWFEGDDRPDIHRNLLGPEQNLTGLILPAEGPHRVFVELMNTAAVDGDPTNDYRAEVSPILSFDIVRDTAAPELVRAELAGGRPVVASPVDLPIEVNCTDVQTPAGQLSLLVTSGDGAVLYDGPFLPLVTVNLPAGQGEQSVTVTCGDQVGLESPPQTLSVIVDQTPPNVASVRLNGGEENESASSRIVSLIVDATDLHSNVTALAISDVDGACADLDYRYPADGPGNITLTPAEGPRRVFVCARDEAGNVSANAVASNTINLDTTDPAIGAVNLGAGPQTNTRLVALALQNAEDTGFVHLNGDLTQPARHPLNAVPGQIELTDGDGVKVVTAWFEDLAGNTSPPFSTTITLDREAPAVGNVTIANDQAIVNEQTVSIIIADTAPDIMSFWEVGAADQCVPRACDHGSYVGFAPASTFTLTPDLGSKRVCWQFCDAAGNLTAPGSHVLDLGTHVPRPRPSLTRIDPRSYVAYSQEDEGYPVTFSGTGIANDTRARVGNFVLPCTPLEPVDDCRADADGGCAVEGGQCAASCATSCVVELSAAIAHHAGSYVVRLETPIPVAGGLGTSAEALFMSIVAPLPIIHSISPRGVTQAVDAQGVPIAQEVEITVTGLDFADNIQFRLGEAFGRVLELGPRDEDGLRTAVVTLSTATLEPSDLEDTEFVGVNPTPGGGSSGLMSFGINPVATPCEAGGCVSNLRWTKTPRSDYRGVRQGYQFGAGYQESVWASGGRAASLQTPDGERAGRFVAGDGGLLVPAILGANGVFDLEDTAGSGPAVRAVSTIERNNGEYTGTPAQGIQSAYIFEGLSFIPPDLFTDCDGDGDSDLVRLGERSLEVRLNDGQGVFGDGVITQLDYNVRAADLGDMDGDGQQDLVIAQEFNDAIRVLRADGCVFVEGPTHPAPSGQWTRGVRIVDLNGDQQPDILSVAHTGHVLVAWSRGDGTHSERVEVARIFGNVYGFDVGDFNRDGAPDLIASNSGNRRSTIYLNDGAEGFFAIGQGVLPGATAAVRVADFNADGLPDYVVAHSLLAGDAISIRIGAYHPHVDLGYTTAQTLPISRSYEYANIQVADTNGDGHLDILVNGEADGSHIFHGLGDGRFVPGPVLDSGSRQYEVKALDINGDGLLDVIHRNADNYTIFHGEGDRSLGGTSTAQVSERDGQYLVAGRPIGGGLSNLIMVEKEGNDNYLRTLTPNGPGTYDVGPEFPLGQAIRTVQSGRFDDDDIPDIIYAHRVNAWRCRVGLANGSWAPPADSPNFAVDSVTELAIGDLNGDELDDFAYFRNQSQAVAGDTFHESSVYIFLNDGDCEFDQLGNGRAIHDDDQPIAQLRLGDLNGDGFADLVMAMGRTRQCQADGECSNCNFAQFCPYSDVDDCSSQTDCNGPGVYVAMNNGDNTFADRAPLPFEADHAGALDLMDINGDGHLDVLLGRVSALGQGDGTFAAEPLVLDFPQSAEFQGFILGDATGDGIVDLLALETFEGEDQEFNELKIVPGRGNGEFGSPIQVDTVLGPTNIHLADLNGDGVASAYILGEPGGLARVSAHSPTGWTQSFDELPAMTVPLDEGQHLFTYRQFNQFVEHLAVSVRIEGQGVANIQLTLRAPDGREVLLDDGSDRPDPLGFNNEPAPWRETYTSALPSGCHLGQLHGWQPDGEWTLIADVGDATAVLRDFRITTQGRFSRPQDDACVAPIPYRIGESVWGTTLNAPSVHTASCGGSARSSEAVFSFIAQDDGPLCLNTNGSSFDTVLHVRADGCGDQGNQVDCDDDDGDGSRSQLELDVESGVRYFVFVDGFGPNRSGPFILNSTVGTCADSAPEAPAACP